MVPSPSAASFPSQTGSPPSSPGIRKAEESYATVWQRINGSPIDTHFSISKANLLHHFRLPKGQQSSTSISSPISREPSSTSTAGISDENLDSAALYEAMHKLERPESPFRRRFRGLTGSSLSGSLRVSRSDPDLSSRCTRAAAVPDTLRPVINSAVPLSVASPLVLVFGDDGEEMQVESQEANRGTVRGLSRTKAKGLSRSISNLFRRSALDGEKTKAPVTLISLGVEEALKPTYVLEKPGTDSPSVAPSCFSWESNEDSVHKDTPPRSATLTLKRIATFLKKVHAHVEHDVPHIGSSNDDQSVPHPTSIEGSTQPMPAAYTLANYAFEALPDRGLPPPEQASNVASMNEPSSKSGTRRRMNSLISKISTPRSPRKTKPIPLTLVQPFSPASCTASASPLGPPSESIVSKDLPKEQTDGRDLSAPPRVLREECSKWSDSSVGHELSASAETKDETSEATQEVVEELISSRRSSGVLGEEDSYTTGGFESSTTSSAPIESPVVERTSFCERTRQPSDASDYDDDSAEAATDAASAILQEVQGEESIIEILDSNIYITSAQTLFEDCATEPFFEAEEDDQDEAIHFAADSDDITPASHIFETSSSSASGLSSSNHFYDVSFASTAPSSRSHGSRKAAASAADYQYRALPASPAAVRPKIDLKPDTIRHHSSLRDIRGQAIGLPVAERTKYLAPGGPCCAGCSGRKEVESGRTTPCMHLPLLLPTSPRRPGTASSSCTEGGPLRPPTPSGLVVAMPLSAAPLRKRRASFSIRRSALSCEAGGLLCTCSGNCKRTSVDGGLSRSASSCGLQGDAGRAATPVSAGRPVTADAAPYAMF